MKSMKIEFITIKTLLVFPDETKNENANRTSVSGVRTCSRAKSGGKKKNEKPKTTTTTRTKRPPPRRNDDKRFVSGRDGEKLTSNTRGVGGGRKAA